jgi:hypothetical protein
MAQASASTCKAAVCRHTLAAVESDDSTEQRHAQNPSKESTQSPGLTLLTFTPKPVVLTILSVEHVKVFVEVQEQSGTVYQGPRTYSWEGLRKLDGAAEAVADFLIRKSA